MRHNWIDGFSQRRYHLEATERGWELRVAGDPDGTYGPPVESIGPYAVTIARELCRVAAELETLQFKVGAEPWRDGQA